MIMLLNGFLESGNMIHAPDFKVMRLDTSYTFDDIRNISILVFAQCAKRFYQPLY